MALAPKEDWRSVRRKRADPGISLNGGRGSMLGALTGVLLLGVVSNILILSQISSFWIDATYGAIILFALLAAKLTGQESDT